MFKKVVKNVIKSVRTLNREDVVNNLPIVAAFVTVGVGIVSAFGPGKLNMKPATPFVINNYYVIREDKNAKNKE